ncbi:MAG TPA: hypothetical protein VK669_08245 [Candidatus Limnocylindrales bacterium]|nr:hypothetical protein [Candidatus Limnocylindrales bacterium]
MAVRSKTEAAPISKARAWTSVIAGIFVILIICGIGVFLVAAMFAPGVRFTSRSGALFGALGIGFAMLLTGGVLGVLNGVAQLRTGRPSMPLTIASFVIMPLGLLVMLIGAKLAQ